VGRVFDVDQVGEQADAHRHGEAVARDEVVAQVRKDIDSADLGIGPGRSQAVAEHAAGEQVVVAAEDLHVQASTARRRDGAVDAEAHEGRLRAVVQRGPGRLHLDGSHARGNRDGHRGNRAMEAPGAMPQRFLLVDVACGMARHRAGFLRAHAGHRRLQIERLEGSAQPLPRVLGRVGRRRGRRRTGREQRERGERQGSAHGVDPRT